MRERRWPWVVSSILLMAAAVATGWSIYLHWLPCRGTLLSGSVVRGFRFTRDFSDECLRRMDGDLPSPDFSAPSEQTPWASELGVVAMVLAGTAWLVLVLGMRWSLRTKAVACLPGLASLTLAATLTLVTTSAVITDDPARSADNSITGLLVLTLEVAALVALGAILVWGPGVDGRSFMRLLLLAWGTTAFGAGHIIVDYIFMIVFSQANWDMPPLTGSFTAVAMMVAAVLTLVLTLRSKPPPTSTTGSGGALSSSSLLR